MFLFVKNKLGFTNIYASAYPGVLAIARVKFHRISELLKYYDISPSLEFMLNLVQYEDSGISKSLYFKLCSIHKQHNAKLT